MKLHKLREGGIRFTNLPTSGQQRILQKTLSELSKFVTKTPEQIIFHAADGDVSFNILYPPGRHCLTCGEQLPSSGGNGKAEAKVARSCREHVKTHGKSAIKTERWPNGYIHYPNAYVCAVVEDKLTKALMKAGA